MLVAQVKPLVIVVKDIWYIDSLPVLAAAISMPDIRIIETGFEDTVRLSSLSRVMWTT